MADDATTNATDALRGEATDATADTDATVLSGDAALDEPLPADVQDGLGRLFGGDGVETMRDWADELTSFTGGSLDVQDLCHTDERTAHYGVRDGETHYFACFYDAVVLSALTDDPVDVHTESPGGTTIEATADGDGSVSVTPADAVVSFGVGDDVEPPEDRELTHADVYAAVCPYVRAFPDAASYEAWAADVDAATFGVPLADATQFTAALVE